MAKSPGGMAISLKRAAALLKTYTKPISGEVEAEITAEAAARAGELFEELFGIPIEFPVKDDDERLEAIRPALVEHFLARDNLPEITQRAADRFRKEIPIKPLVLNVFNGLYANARHEAIARRGLYAFNLSALRGGMLEGEERDALVELLGVGVVYRLKPDAPLEELAWLLTGPRLDGSESDTFTLATSQFMPHIFEHVTSKELATTRDLSIRQGKRVLRLRAKSYPDMNASVANPPEEVLKRMHNSLLRVKQYGAALLKTQLDLMNQAYAAGGELPTFHYNFAEALERQGYAKQSHGAYHPDTMEGLRRRVAALAHQSIEVLELSSKKNNSRYIEATPYWIVEATRRLTAGDEYNHSIILLDDPNTPILTGFTMRPGLWWPLIDMGHYRLEIPSSVLELSTDGNGNEVGRLALQLTPTLAIWERSSQNLHAGKDVCYSVGALLEGAAYTTREVFMNAHNETAKRTREHLASIDGAIGALPLLSKLGAFNIDIKDEAEFFASGRGWRERFWEAQLRVSVRNLRIAKKPRLSKLGK